MAIRIGTFAASALRPPVVHRALAGALFAFACVGCVPTSSIGIAAEAPTADANANATALPAVRVAGEVTAAQTFDLAALAKLPRKQVKASTHGVEGEWEGVPLIEILRAAGAPVDDALRGRNLTLYVRISAADGYRVVFALAELDAKFRDDNVILADQRDGKPLAADEGPLRVIAPLEKRAARWIRQVERIDVLRAPE